MSTELDALATRLETALENITGHRPIAPDGMTTSMRGGASAGLLIAAAIDAYYQFTMPEDSDDVDVHRALVISLERAAGAHRINVMHTFINIVMSWLTSGRADDQLAADDVAAALMHLGSAYTHTQSHIEATEDAPEADGAGPDGLHEDTGAESYAPHSMPSAAVDRLGEAASALGIVPVVAVETDDGDPDDAHDHPLVPVAVLAGVVTGRATMELITMIDSADAHMGAHAGPLWVSGFTSGITSPFAPEPREDVVAAAALRLVHLIGLWHENRSDATYAPAIAALCKGAAHAGRAQGLGTADVDVQAEYIAVYGVDEAAAARNALTSARDAVKALIDAGVNI